MRKNHKHKAWLVRIYERFCSSNGLTQMPPQQQLFYVKTLEQRKWLSKYMSLADRNIA